MAAGAGVSNGGGSGEAKKPANLCLHLGCVKRAHHGKPGERAQFCAEHAKGQEGLERSGLKLCEHEGCKKMPSFGVPGGRRQFCQVHKPEGMVSLTGYRCKKGVLESGKLWRARGEAAVLR